MSQSNLPRRHVGRVVKKEIEIAAPANLVYEAWADPKRIAGWFVDRAEGDMRRDDLVTWIFEQFGYRLPVEVYEAVPDHKLVFGGEPDGRPVALQEVILESKGGKTRLYLANSGFGEGDVWDDEYEGVASGWQMALSLLKLYLEQHHGETRRHVLVMRPATFEYVDVFPLFATRDGLERWLGTGVSLGADPLTLGATVSLDLIDGPSLRGEVIAESPRELMLAWPERRGALTLKAFRAGPTRMLGLAFDAWPDGDESFDEVARSLDGALGRLLEVVSPRG